MVIQRPEGGLYAGHYDTGVSGDRTLLIFTLLSITYHKNCQAVDINSNPRGRMPRTLGDFETLLLLALIRLKERAYGATIHREIEARTGRSVAIGAVYTGLARLRKNGYVTATIGDPTPERGGRRKKFYKIHADGAVALTNSLRMHRHMTDGIEEDLEVLANPD